MNAWIKGGLASAMALASAALVGTWSTPARACGGLFCDAGPQSMPVDQSGENILFVIDGDKVETHIQIQYEGDPAKFAWVIPLPAVPEFAVGSEQLFANLLAGTVPTYGFTTTMDNCRMPPNARGDVPQSTGLGGAENDDGGTGEPMGPDVLLRENVGAFEITVLSGGTADEVINWLNDNGYQQDPEAAPIFAEYLAEESLFGAIKLQTGGSVDQIHPIALRYETGEPCVPLRLTRIAAVDDMDVRTFFLSRSRVVPTNYRHVLVNPLKIDWLSTGANYREVITAAVDAESADGRAFVTEYAGTSDVVARGLLDPRWNADVFLALPETEVLPQLVSQGLLACFGGPEGCITQHPVVEPLLVEFLLGPSVSMGDYWTSPEAFAGIVQWQPEAFAAAMADRIVEPARNADDLLEQWPYVTRMYTTISPHEMTADPIFHENPDLPDVASTRMADRRLRCDGDSVFTLPDGREVYLPAGAPWPEFDEQMPWEEDIDEMPQVGGPMNLVDNTDTIDDLLRDYNAALGWPTGCGQCRAGASNLPAGLAFFGLLALGLRRRRRA